MGSEKEQALLDILTDLRDRIDITKRARIKASTRLRKKHERFEKIIYIYSILALVLTIWFFGTGDNDNDNNISKFLLILSLTVTFLSMYLNMKNYKERAGNFETNYQNLDVLLNKLDRKEIDIKNLEIDDIKQYQREYEKLLIDKENHLDIDFFIAYSEYDRSKRKREDKTNLDKDKQSPSSNKAIKFEDQINKFNRYENVKYICLASFPISIIIFVIIFELILESILNLI
ncbi:SLATT domain-containing protein [Virgibacillus salexigens]|uniref:SLATT domain-containing protein n=1 Tax=Virgibacillus TaxID=84406 RepID=UPI001371D470|nr:SLATT domain-containing protein [Virgibacillus massiliensis]MYL41810.1 SLATT domain-containing protein [Virgibacillus massiliensis]